ncbi:hypothetical protein Tsubulata_039607 [Turnera subulata]|uniref:tRNA/rRNA methyltransferase SpoU type domain-containing protein n=1 Tax=Turnera subulata TaxID=218843 RepID=A0A9Q0F7U6_9ROSI|nr:hypothetical protein Tsubulata_039607 [Turnera subulata]
MSSTETKAMDSVVSSLSESFKQVPLSAIPAIIDCILASTALSPSWLFASLLDSFQNTTKDVIKEDQKMETGQRNYVSSMVGALCYLLKKTGTKPEDMRSFIQKCFLPLMIMGHALEREMLNQVLESFLDVVSMTKCWNVLQSTLVPFCLRSVGLSVGMLQNGEHDAFGWDQCSDFEERRDAYNVLSLYLSFLTDIEEYDSGDAGAIAEEFGIRAESEFWGEIKRGLVDAEGLVRKQSLHILKKALQISKGSQLNPSISQKKTHDRRPVPRGMTRREMWADKEAKSLGVGNLCVSFGSPLSSQQQWEAFILLYEMLEEYGTHLVEAAWNHQVTLLLRFSIAQDSFASSVCGGGHQNQIETMRETFGWLTILWQLGFCHENPQVRCLIMQSFLGIDWMKYGGAAKSVPESFILGPFMEGLNDPVHHKDFGVKGVYTSKTIEGAVRFLHQYASYLNKRLAIIFLCSLASVAKHQSFGRAGLMGLVECIASTARGAGTHVDSDAEGNKQALSDVDLESCPEKDSQCEKVVLLDVMRFVIESSKQHFNPNYRLRVCENVVDAATSMLSPLDVPFETLLLFISTLPREFTDYGGTLRVRIQDWLIASDKMLSVNCCITDIRLLKSLEDFPERFASSKYLIDAVITFDDEDLDVWESEAKRWARLLFLLVQKEEQLSSILTLIRNYGVNLSKQHNYLKWLPVKFLILTRILVEEIQMMQERAAEHGYRIRFKSESSSPEKADELLPAEAYIIHDRFHGVFLSIMEELVSFANMSSSIFWSSIAHETILPSSVMGKLGGPSQRRLSSSTTTLVLQAVTSIQAVASISAWCSQLTNDVRLNSAWTFLWKFFAKTISSPTHDSETGAELSLAAYEALAPALQALVSTFSPLSLDLIRENDKSLQPGREAELWLDRLVLSFLQNVNDLLAVAVLARSRRAVLLKWKWLCLESLLSIPHCALRNGLNLESNGLFFSNAAIRLTLSDIVESLENAGEDSVLPMLRSIRLALGLFASETVDSLLSSTNGVDIQMIWNLVRPSWILHVNSNKRRVASIAALLSSVVHNSVFADESMHFANGEPGPLKWFLENVLQEGTRSPRTIRLAALHLTGLWLSHPKTIKYYIKELKLLTLYGSVAFDEDFEGELADNHDARTEVSLLSKSLEPELTEAFINTELYGRVSVAVLFYKLADLADLVGSADETDESRAALESGKLFLLELLDSVVNDKDLSKELYKKYSARNNLPAVRQYLETFAINIYLKFPSLVKEQLVPVLRDYDMRPQALSSYVFVAANIILHASKANQSRHLAELLPPIVPLLTSHHHSLRGFTQLLVYQVICKYFPLLEVEAIENIPLEKRCFEDLKSYLAKNPDCRRLRSSMEGYLDAYNPAISTTPAGTFVNRVEELEFECVPTSLMEEVLNFLNDVREDLRCSMAKDIVTIKNESLKIDDEPSSQSMSSTADLPFETSLDFQKKLTFSKHEQQNADSSSFSGSNHVYKQLLEKEKEDELLDQSLQSRSLNMEKLRASRQQIILVASLLDRIPNLAGLARTCEVFKASGLAIADTSILRDKQFQLISVTAEKWVPVMEVPENSVKHFLEKKKREGFSILGLEQTANSVPLDKYVFPERTVLVLGREKEGIPVDIIHVLDACIEIPQLGVVRSLNVHASALEQTVVTMSSISKVVLLISIFNILYPKLYEAKVFMVLMDNEAVFAVKSKHSASRAEEEAMAYKEKLVTDHDLLLESLLQKHTYTKLYSYTHLLNGFAIHVKTDEVLSILKNATGVRAIHEDIKMEKLTTHTPYFLGLPAHVWPTLGGVESSGEGVVIGVIDTGINPFHPSFQTRPSRGLNNITKYNSKFKGKCVSGENFPPEACNEKIVGAQYFASAAISAGDFNATRDYASPFDADGHGRQVIHTASTAAGNHQIEVIANDFNYGNASGMAPGARIAVYKALYTFGGYMADVVAAVDQAVEDGVDILSLSIGPSNVPSGPSAFLSVLEIELLFATKAGVLVVQAAGNGGPSSSSILSFSPWITSVAASITDRKYNNTIILGDGQTFSGTGLAPPTDGDAAVQIAFAVDVSHSNISNVEVQSCQYPEYFISSLARGKLIICAYDFDFEADDEAMANVADTIQQIGAAGFIIVVDHDVAFEHVMGTTMTMQVPAIILSNMQDSRALWEYYNNNTIRNGLGQVVEFAATARILDGRRAFFTGQAPVVAAYSSRGPDVNNALLQTADVLKPNVMAPGSSIWAAWSPGSVGDPSSKGQNFALASGTSMATPHIAGVAALIKQKHPTWSPAAITSALMTTAHTTDFVGSPILAQSTDQLAPATPFDLGAGSINPARALDPGLIFDADFEHYVQFLCAVPGVDSDLVRRATGTGCTNNNYTWCSDLNAASVTVSNLVGSRKVIRHVTNVNNKNELYRVTVKEPLGVNVTVWPQKLWIRSRASRHFRIVLKATRATGAYTFGELVLHGSRNHLVRVPIAVYVNSSHI